MLKRVQHDALFYKIRFKMHHGFSFKSLFAHETFKNGESQLVFAIKQAVTGMGLGKMPEDGHNGGHFLQLEKEVEKPWSPTTWKAQESGGREFPIEETRRRSGPSQTDFTRRAETVWKTVVVGKIRTE